MNGQKSAAGILGAALFLSGCTVQNVDFSTIKQPARAMQLDAYDVFVGTWTWDAVMLNASTTAKQWTGTAEWSWTLEKRSLRGTFQAKSEGAEYDSEGIWSWNPKSHRYVWWMFNNWGYPQQGSANYDSPTKTWYMTYRSIGLDGTTSYGRHRITVIDNNTLDWDLTEWASPFHLVKKMEMNGTYKRSN